MWDERYWAFLSYSSHDRIWAQRIQRDLERYVVPRHLVGAPIPAGFAPKRFRPIFRDRTELAASTDLKSALRLALKRSAYLIVLCSKHSAASRWVEEEILRFRALHNGDHILTVVVDGSTSQAAVFPSALFALNEGDLGPRNVEPIAADLRTGGDGRRLAKLKILAGMLGIGLDDLVRRDTHRRHVRLLAIAAASATGMVLAGWLAVNATLAQAEAQKQRGQAESLIEFMLGDLRAKLEPVGRLDLMEGAGRKVLDYYGSQDASKLDGASLSRRSRAFRMMGEISVQRGDLGQALNAFEHASSTTEELLARAPNQESRVFDHAQSVFWVGEINRERGNTSNANRSFLHYRQLARELTKRNPSMESWRAEVAYADTALGTVALEQGKTSEAEKAFREAKTIFEDAARRHPTESQHLLELAQSDAYLADTYERRGLNEDAHRLRLAELGIYSDILVRDPTIWQARFSQVVTLQTLGRLAKLFDHASEALTALQSASVKGEALLAMSRGNMDLAGVVAIGHVELGRVLLSSGRVNEAKVAQRRASELIASALSHDKTVKLWQDYGFRAELLGSAVAAREGLPTQALQLDENIVSRLEAKADRATDLDWAWILDTARLQTGDDMLALGLKEQAHQEWARIGESSSVLGWDPRRVRISLAANRRLGRSPS